MSKPSSFIAVITGDVVDSGSLPDSIRQLLPDRIEAAYRYVYQGSWDLRLSNIDVFRGESWQLYCGRPSDALWAVLHLRCHMRAKGGFDSRMAIGIGAHGKLDFERVSKSQGEAFELSGKALDSMTDDATLSVAMSESLDRVAGFIRAATNLLDVVMSRWTDRQAMACMLASMRGIPGDSATHEALGSMMDPPITKQAFGKHLAAARWGQVLDAMQFFRISMSQFTS